MPYAAYDIRPAQTEHRGITRRAMRHLAITPDPGAAWHVQFEYDDGNGVFYSSGVSNGARVDVGGMVYVEALQGTSGPDPSNP